MSKFKIKKRDRNILIIATIAIFLFGNPTFLSILFATVPLTEPGLYALSSTPITQHGDGGCGPVESWLNDGWVSGPESVVKTELSSFKFVTSKTHRYCKSTGCSSTVTYQVDVYRNGILIDTIKDIPNGMIIPPDTPGAPSQCIGTELGATCGPNPTQQIYYRAYGDDGTVYGAEEATPRLFVGPTEVELPNSKTGINVVFGKYTYVAARQCDNIASLAHKIEIVGTTEKLPATGFSNVNGLMVFEGEEFPADVSKHSTIKITKVGDDDITNGEDSNILLYLGLIAGMLGLIIILRRIKK